MDPRIIYTNSSGNVAVIVPAECGVPLELIAKKDVPDGLPFWIVDAASIPSDRTFREAWQIDESTAGEPHGVGDSSAYESWVAEAEFVRIAEEMRAAFAVELQQAEEAERLRIAAEQEGIK